MIPCIELTQKERDIYSQEVLELAASRDRCKNTACTLIISNLINICATACSLTAAISDNCDSQSDKTVNIKRICDILGSGAA
jgi:hypothetical protein